MKTFRFQCDDTLCQIYFSVRSAMVCDFEGLGDVTDDDCLLRNITEGTNEMWAPTTSAALGAPFFDHTMDYQTGQLILDITRTSHGCHGVSNDEQLHDLFKN